MPFTAFGTAWFDYDNDGWLDLLVLNGAVQVIESLAAKGDKFPLEQRNQLFHNQAGKGFTETTDDGGENFMQAEVSRGAAFGDIDNDGDTDVAIFNNNGPLRLLRAVWQAWRLLGRRRPACAISFGGYAAGPGGLAARLRGIPLLVHEQNRVPGMTNRTLARFASRVLQAFPGSWDERLHPITCGNPVRRAVVELDDPGQRFAGRTESISAQ